VAAPQTRRHMALGRGAFDHTRRISLSVASGGLGRQRGGIVGDGMALGAQRRTRHSRHIWLKKPPESFLFGALHYSAGQRANDDKFKQHKLPPLSCASGVCEGPVRPPCTERLTVVPHKCTACQIPPWLQEGPGPRRFLSPAELPQSPGTD